MGRGAGPGGDPTITHERSTWHRVESANRVGRVTRRRGSRKGTVTGCRVRETWWQRASNYDGSCDEIRAMSGMPLTTERDNQGTGPVSTRSTQRALHLHLFPRAMSPLAVGLGDRPGGWRGRRRARSTGLRHGAWRHTASVDAGVRLGTVPPRLAVVRLGLHAFCVAAKPAATLVRLSQRERWDETKPGDETYQSQFLHRALLRR